MAPPLSLLGPLYIPTGCGKVPPTIEESLSSSDLGERRSRQADNGDSLWLRAGVSRESQGSCCRPRAAAHATQLQAQHFSVVEDNQAAPWGKNVGRASGLHCLAPVGLPTPVSFPEDTMTSSFNLPVPG